MKNKFGKYKDTLWSIPFNQYGIHTMQKRKQLDF